jgi:glycine cleavage system pyridoxal-binding protein P
VLRLPVDDQGCILAENLPKLESPAIVCLQAGNVDSGASDPFVPLIEWAHSQGAWARGAEVWAVLVSLGRDGVSEIVARHVALAKRFAAGLSAGGARVLNDIRLNQVVVSFGDSSTTDAVVAAVQRGGTCWCGPTTWQGHRGMRVSVSNWATTETDVDRSVAAILEAMGQAGSG